MSTQPPDSLVAPLLRELSIAWQALVSYPPGHPLAAAAVERAVGRLGERLADGPLELLAGRDALLWGDHRLAGPTAVRLAELLRRRNAAAVRFDPGVDAREVERFLRGLVVDPRQARAAGSLARELEAAGVTRIGIRDLDFAALSVVEADDEPALPEAGGMWEKLVRRLVAGGQLPGERLAAWVAGGRRAVELLAALLGRAPGLAAEDDSWRGRALAAIPGHAADLFVQEGGAGGVAMVDALLGALPAELRGRLELAVGTALAGRSDAGAALDALAGSLAPESLARVRSAVSGARQHGTAAKAASAGGAASEPDARGGPGRGGAAGHLDLAALQRLRQLFAGQDLDAVPEPAELVGGAEVLVEVATGGGEPAVPAGAAALAERLSGAPHRRGLRGALLELAERPDLAPEALGPVVGRLEGMYLAVVEAGDLERSLDLVERCAARAAGDDLRAAAFRELLGRLAAREVVAELVAVLERLPEEAAEAARRQLARLGPRAVESLLDLLAESDDRGTRHRVLVLLSGLGGDVAALAAVRLADPRWYVVRNMLVLLRRLGDPGSLSAVRRCADHSDLRVRLEAIRNLFAFDQELPRELLRAALNDRDPRLTEAAIELAGTRGIVEAVDPLVELIRRPDPFGRRGRQRVLALRALGELAQPHALEGLGRYLRRFTLLPVPLEERRELYRTLHRYPEPARRPFVERGLKQKDPEVRRIAAALARQGAAP